MLGSAHAGVVAAGWDVCHEGGGGVEAGGGASQGDGVVDAGGGVVEAGGGVGEAGGGVVEAGGACEGVCDASHCVAEAAGAQPAAGAAGSSPVAPSGARSNCPESGGGGGGGVVEGIGVDVGVVGGANGKGGGVVGGVVWKGGGVDGGVKGAGGGVVCDCGGAGAVNSVTTAVDLLGAIAATSSSANSEPCSYRSRGAFARARASTGSRVKGRFGRSARIEGTGAEMCLIKTVAVVSPAKGTVPARHSKSTTPSE